MLLRSIQIGDVSVVHPFSSLGSIPLYGRATVDPFTPGSTCELFPVFTKYAWSHHKHWFTDFVWMSVPFPRDSIQGLLGLMVNICLTLHEIEEQFSRVAIQFHVPTRNGGGLHLPHSFTAFGFVGILYFNHSNRCVMISPCGFNLHLPNG